jgi:hypothetical protein
MANETCPRCQGPGCVPHPAHLRFDAGCKERPMDAHAAGSAHSDAPNLLSDEDWSAIALRFVSEHTALSVRDADLFFLGWTAPRAWWEAGS